MYSQFKIKFWNKVIIKKYKGNFSHQFPFYHKSVTVKCKRLLEKHSEMDSIAACVGDANNLHKSKLNLSLCQNRLLCTIYSSLCSVSQAVFNLKCLWCNISSCLLLPCAQSGFPRSIRIGDVRQVNGFQKRSANGGWFLKPHFSCQQLVWPCKSCKRVDTDGFFPPLDRQTATTLLTLEKTNKPNPLRICAEASA